MNQGKKQFKIYRIAIFLMACCLSTHSFGKAQSLFNFPPETLSERMERIQEFGKETDQTLSFDYKKMKGEYAPSFTAQTNNMEEWLYRSLESSKFTYEKTSDRSYVIIERKTETDDPDPPKIQQRREVTGTVTDMNNEPLIGVNVVEKGTTNGTVTNVDGNFSLDVAINSVIVFSYTGFTEQETMWDGQSVMNIVLHEDSELLDEVVVVGYGTQRKVNLTGAVEQISNESFENRPMPNISRGIQGLIPNLNITMYDGSPIRNPEFNVRGITSIGSGGSALVLIDGVEGNPSTLNPNDIESISVLKDASSAAIYGAKGTFGVILINTKNPSSNQPTRINYSGNYSVYERTIIPDLVTDGYTWASHFNEAHRSWYGQYPTAINSAFPFSQEYLAELKNRSQDSNAGIVDINPSNGNYVYYDSNNWLDELYKKNHAGTEHNLSVSKASDKTSFYLSGRYYNQDGIYKYNSDEYTSANLRAKASAKLLPWLEVSNNFDYSHINYKEPLYYGGWGFTSEIVMGWSMRAFPVSPMLNPDGTITEMGARGIGDLYYGKNKAEQNSGIIRNTIAFSTNFLDDKLHINGDYSFTNTTTTKNRAYSPVPYSNKPDVTTWLGNSRFFEHHTKTAYDAFNLYADYTLNLQDSHEIKTLIGVNSESSSRKYTEVSRDGLLFPDRPSFTLSSGSNYETIDNITEWNTLGLFYRINYNYSSRYLLELNGRYDGSSKFPSMQRWGFFPSFSGAWNISHEPFWEVPEDIISFLKIRASWGSLGNGNIAPYLYLESMPVSLSNRIIKGGYVTQTKNPNVVPDGLTWEKAITANIGIELNLFKNRFKFTADVYSRKTTDMFTVGPTLPDVFGAAVPKGNYADLDTKGFELSIGWNDNIHISNEPFNYDARFVLADNTSKITKFFNPEYILNDYYEGMMLGEIWGYETEGFFVNQNDIDNHADQSRFKSNNAGVILPGDIKFKDLNGDGEISNGRNTVKDPGDMRVIGNSLPRFTYGFQLGMKYRNVSLSAFLQGVAKRDWYPPSESFYFWGQYNRPYSPLPTSHLGNYYNADPENPNPDAYFPRYSGLLAYNASGALAQPQTKYLQDASYLRLKNITLSYALPDNLIQKIAADDITVFFTGQNLFTFSNLFKYSKNIDPETIESINPDTGDEAFGGGNGYPMLKTYTVGINLTF